jgi:hypothetical protein
MQITAVPERQEQEIERNRAGEDRAGDERADEERAGQVSALDAKREDAYWKRMFWQERYYNPALDYEDYAPAYCVGYIGFVQYGGEFEDAEKSLCANWERIKGDSRLALEGALPAMRAAWQHMAGVH